MTIDITQADRDFAADVVGRSDEMDDLQAAHDIRAGRRDGFGLVIKAANFRTAATEELRAENGRLIVALTEIAGMGWAGAPDVAMRKIARAALASKGGEG